MAMAFLRLWSGFLPMALFAAAEMATLDVERRQAIPAQLPGNWSSVGCFTDISTARTLSAALFVNITSMTIDTCIAFCEQKGYIFAGVEFGQECYCDSTIQDPGLERPIEECNFGCNGDRSQVCGAGNRLNIFYSGAPFPTFVQTIGETGWRFQGCFTDDPQIRTLRVPVAIPQGVTAESCTAACQTAGGFTHAGLEVGRECWCDNLLDNTASVVSNNECRAVCDADHSEYCGRQDRVAIYQFSNSDGTPSQPQGCSSINVANFTLQAIFNNPPADGPASLTLKVILVEMVPDIMWTILSACTSCCSEWPTFSIQNSVFLPRSISNPAQLVSVTPRAGDSPGFLASSPPFPGNQGYCTTEITSAEPGTPPLLAFNGNTANWALCPNNTANGRMDVVFSPVLNHPHYTLTSCSGVTIQMVGA